MYEEKSVLNLKDQRSMNYIINLPNDYYVNINISYPVILFLHGIGERGDDINLVKRFGIHKYIKDLNLPFIVVSPQCPGNDFWDSHLYDIELLIKRIKDNYKANTDKICIVGTSMGAYGAWNFAMQRPKLFTSIVSVAGGAMIPKYAETIKHIPAYIAHGEADSSINPNKSVEIYEALKKVGGHAYLNLVPKAGHELCTNIFSDEGLYQWIKENTF